jgi:hypothetical protein
MAAHHSHAHRDRDHVKLRTVFAAEPQLESTIRGRIDEALAAGCLSQADGRATRWELLRSYPSSLSADEAEQAQRLRS